MENDEKKYEDVIKALKGLQEVKAPENFEADLQRRINSEIFQKKEKKSFWQNIFAPAKLIPSLGLVATAIVIFFVVETNSEEMDNPFLIEPRVREDVIEVTDFDELRSKQEESSQLKSLKKDESVPAPKENEAEKKSVDQKTVLGKEKSGQVEGLSAERDYAMDQNVAESFETSYDSSIVTANVPVNPSVADSLSATTPSGTSQIVTKDELNFRQIQLSTEEQKAVNQLKMQIQSADKPNKTQK